MKIEAVDDIKGSVQKVESKTVSVVKESVGSPERLESKSESFYDKSGNLIKVIYLIPGKHSQKTINKFNSENQLIETAYYTDNSLNLKTEFSYDSRGQIVERKFFDAFNNLQNVYRPVFTKENLRIEESVHEPYIIEGKRVEGNINYTIAPDISISFSSKNVYKAKAFYDTEDNLKEVSFYNQKNKISGKIFVIYDSEKKPVKVTKFGDDTSLYPNNLKRWQEIVVPILNKVSKFLLTVHNSYKLAVRREYKKAGQCFVYGVPFDEMLIEYDSQKRVSLIKNISMLCGESKTTFEYDEKGNSINKTSILSSQILHLEKFEYEYDSNDNWIKRKTFYKLPTGNMKQIMEIEIITYRTIIYY